MTRRRSIWNAGNEQKENETAIRNTVHKPQGNPINSKINKRNGGKSRDVRTRNLLLRRLEWWLRCGKLAMEQRSGGHERCKAT